jgi:DNA-binding response OmpR family regulator
LTIHKEVVDAIGSQNDTLEQDLSGLIRKKLLIVDDNGAFAESLADVLSQQGFEVRWATKASKAKTLAREFLPDVLIVDVNLVTASGIDVAQQFARERLASGFVFLTGSVDMDARDIPELLKTAAVVLHKPAAKEDLLNAIGTLSREDSDVIGR